MKRERAALERALARKGETIILRRLTLAPLAVQSAIDVTCRAFVSGYRPEELIGGITQADSLVIISPKEIIASQWPGGQPPTSASTANLPRRNDKAVIQGRERNVEAVGPFYVDGELVRIEMRVTG